MSSGGDGALSRHVIGDADAVQDDTRLHGDQRDDKQHRNEEHGLDRDFPSIEGSASQG